MQYFYRILYEYDLFILYKCVPKICILYFKSIFRNVHFSLCFIQYMHINLITIHILLLHLWFKVVSGIENLVWRSMKPLHLETFFNSWNILMLIIFGPAQKVYNNRYTFLAFNHFSFFKKLYIFSLVLFISWNYKSWQYIHPCLCSRL